MRFLVNRRHGISDELMEIFSDIEGINLQLLEDWSTTTSYCFETKDAKDAELIVPILQAGYLLVGNEKIELESCPTVYATTDTGDELDPAVVIRVVQRVSHVTLASPVTTEPAMSSKCLAFCCSPQTMSLVCATNYKVQGKNVTFTTTSPTNKNQLSPTTVVSQSSIIPQSTATSYPSQVTSIPPSTSSNSHPPYPYPSQYYQYPPYPHYHYPYPPPDHLQSHAHHPPPAAHRPLYSIDIFHDGENCPCSGSLNAVEVFETTIRLIISRFLGDNYQPDKFDIHANVHVKWNFVLSSEKISSSLSRFLAELETLGAIRIDPGKKSDAVDTSIKKLMDQYRTDYLTRSNDVNKCRIAVLISGDRDFAESLKSLRLVGANVMLLYNSENASRALRAIISPDYVLGSWLSLVRSTSRPIAKVDAQPESTLSSLPAPPTSETCSEKNQLSECEWCRLSKGESWYHKDGTCPYKPHNSSICSWCLLHLNESLEHDEKYCPNKPANECQWCLQMLGKSLTHRSRSCPNNVTTVNKCKRRAADIQCIWCLKNGFRSTNHLYFFCRNKPLGTHHCPYCYRICGKVEFHTIHQCPSTPSLAEYGVSGSSSKKNPHVNEMSLKDQIFHLEIKIVKCQESYLGCVVKAEEKKLLPKLRILHKTEETLINQLRLLELKTISQNNMVSSSETSPTVSSTHPTSHQTSSLSSILPSSSSILPSSSSSSSSTRISPSAGAAEATSATNTHPDLEKYQNLFQNEFLSGDEGDPFEGNDDEESEGWDEDGSGQRDPSEFRELEGKEDEESDVENDEDFKSYKKRKYEENDEEDDDEVDERIRDSARSYRRNRPHGGYDPRVTSPLSSDVLPTKRTRKGDPNTLSSADAPASPGLSTVTTPVFWKIDRNPG